MKEKLFAIPLEWPAVDILIRPSFWWISKTDWTLFTTQSEESSADDPSGSIMMCFCSASGNHHETCHEWNTGKNKVAPWWRSSTSISSMCLAQETKGLVSTKICNNRLPSVALFSHLGQKRALIEIADGILSIQIKMRQIDTKSAVFFGFSLCESHYIWLWIHDHRVSGWRLTSSEQFEAALKWLEAMHIGASGKKKKLQRAAKTSQLYTRSGPSGRLGACMADWHQNMCLSATKTSLTWKELELC